MNADHFNSMTNCWMGRNRHHLTSFLSPAPSPSPGCFSQVPPQCPGGNLVPLCRSPAGRLKGSDPGFGLAPGRGPLCPPKPPLPGLPGAPPALPRGQPGERRGGRGAAGPFSEPSPTSRRGAEAVQPGAAVGSDHRPEFHPRGRARHLLQNLDQGRYRDGTVHGQGHLAGARGPVQEQQPHVGGNDPRTPRPGWPGERQGWGAWGPGALSCACVPSGTLPLPQFPRSCKDLASSGAGGFRRPLGQEKGKASPLGVQPALGRAPKCCCSCPMRQDRTLPCPFPSWRNTRRAAACSACRGRNQLCPVPSFVPVPVRVTPSEAVGFGGT